MATLRELHDSYASAGFIVLVVPALDASIRDELMANPVPRQRCRSSAKQHSDYRSLRSMALSASTSSASSTSTSGARTTAATSSTTNRSKTSISANNAKINSSLKPTDNDRTGGNESGHTNVGSNQPDKFVVLEKGQSMPLLVFIGNKFKFNPAPHDSVESGPQLGGQERESEYLQLAAKSMKAGVSVLSKWNKHSSRCVVHTGFRSKIVQSYSFAYDSRALKDSTRGACICERVDSSSCGVGRKRKRRDIPIEVTSTTMLRCVRMRSTLKNNKQLVEETLHDLISGADRVFRENVLKLATGVQAKVIESSASSKNNDVSPSAFDQANSCLLNMELARAHCSGRWMLLPDCLWSSMGVNINFSQHFHVDSDDVGMGCAVYSIGRRCCDLDGNAGDSSKDGNATAHQSISSGSKRNADDTIMWQGGELVFPQISAYLQPSDGDFLAWRTNRLLHGVAPFPEGESMGTYCRAAFVFFQTEAVHHGCLKCSD